MHVVCSFESKVQLLFWCPGMPRRPGRRSGAQNPEIEVCCFYGASCAFRMLWSSISAFFLSYYDLPTRPEWPLRNLGFGAESARCVLVEISAHFGASKSTSGAALALLESKDMRFQKA